MRQTLRAAIVLLLLFALPLAGLVAGYAHALRAGPLVEVATFAGAAVLLVYGGIRAIYAVGSEKVIPPLQRKD